METDKLSQLVREGRRVTVTAELPDGSGQMEKLTLTGQVVTATPRIGQLDPDTLDLELSKVREES